MTTQNGRAFNEWLRAQLKAKKMSQRQLAQQSGVDHSTISRLIRGDRMPSLGTATKLARGLRELRDDADTPQYLGLVASGSTNPTARVEYALRADELLTEPQVRQIMEYYLAVRMRRYGRTFADGHLGTGGPGASARSPDRQRTPARDRRRRIGRGRGARRSAPRRIGTASARHRGRTVRCAGARPRGRTRHHQGTTRISPPPPGLGDSERRRLGRRRSHSCPALARSPPGRRRRGPRADPYTDTAAGRAPTSTGQQPATRRCSASARSRRGPRLAPPTPAPRSPPRTGESHSSARPPGRRARATVARTARRRATATRVVWAATGGPEDGRAGRRSPPSS